MKICNLVINNFRNYDHLEIEFSDKLNIIYGNNGTGKSNLIEAIYLLAITKSFRTNTDTNLIKSGTTNTSIKGKIYNDETTIYQVDIDNDGKKVFIDNKKISKISDYVSNINIVLFNPLDTKFINDSPSFRRKILDISISQCDREYLLLLNTYNKLLKNRNAYLKQVYINGNASLDYLDILTNKLIMVGIKINEIRNNYLDNLNKYIGNIYKNIFENGELIVKYKSCFNKKNEEQIKNMFKKNYQHEIQLGKTVDGVHHDDIEIVLDKHSIREYGSVGQQKNAIISYKLSEILILKNMKGNYPILILDDLFSELDNNKINNIIKMLNREVQTFITTTNIDNVLPELLNNSSIYYIKDGIVNREEKNG